MALATGIDTSHYNGDIRTILKSVDFAIGQASVGTWTDPSFVGDQASMVAEGNVRMGYHFAVYGPGDTRQAEEFLGACGSTLGLAIDAEGNTLLSHLNVVAGIIANVRKLDPLKRKILLYGSRDTPLWAHDLGQDANWVADYVGLPNRVGVSPRVPFLIWQRSGTGVDHDLCIKSKSQLLAWLNSR